VGRIICVVRSPAGALVGARGGRAGWTLAARPDRLCGRPEGAWRLLPAVQELVRCLHTFALVSRWRSWPLGPDGRGYVYIKQRRRARLDRRPARDGGDPVPAPERANLGARASAAVRLGLLSVLFAVLGAALVFAGDNATAGSRFYTSTPQFKVWAALIIGVVASFPTVWRVGIDLLRRLGLDPRSVLRSRAIPALVCIALVVTAAVFAGQYARGNGSSFYGGSARVGVIYFLGITASVPAFLAIWECYFELGDGGSTTADHVDVEVHRLLLLRECLLSALTTVGLLVSAGVLATGAQRQAALAAPKYAGPYPSAYVLLWGFGFSALLVVNFLPAFRRLTHRANVVIDTTLPILPPGTGQWQARLQERKDLADLLKVTSGAKDVITSAVLVAGPLISSAFSSFLPGPPT